MFDTQLNVPKSQFGKAFVHLLISHIAIIQIFKGAQQKVVFFLGFGAKCFGNFPLFNDDEAIRAIKENFSTIQKLLLFKGHQQ